ncbi:MAG: hypothetical protein KJO54_05390 [Gammaproteobacteria bacterium]|nr:hypothetical protein [Gammaproteobacteria bacterium]
METKLTKPSNTGAMQTTARWFKLSYYSLGLALLTIAAVPVGCAITARGNSGWETLSDDIRYLSASVVLVVFFLLTSLVAGIRAFKQHRIAALWVMPIGLICIAAIAYAIYGLYIFVFDPFGIT